MTDVSTLIPTGPLLARPDLAELALEGLVRAAAYRPTTAMVCVRNVADVRTDGGEGDLIDQLLFGEVFDVLEVDALHAWGKVRRDGVVGWVARAALGVAGPPGDGATHRVRVAIANVDAADDGSPATQLSLNTLVWEEARDGDRIKIIGGGWVAGRDLADMTEFDAEPMVAAERLMGTSHLLGGRSSFGTDCSGLVQQALFACGLPAPRYPSEQAQLGVAVDPAEARRGDIVVWPHDGIGPWHGHSGVMLNAGMVFHATGHHGHATLERFAEADARYRADGFAAPVFRRL